MKDFFPGHGGLTINVKDNIMFIEASGPWNLEYFTELHSALIAASKQLDIKHYGVYLQLVGQAVTVEGGLEIHSAFVKKSGVKAMAVDFSRCETTVISEVLFQKTYSLAEINFQFFDTPESAKTWLNQQLA